jgi:hypothetical protein
MMSGCDLTDKVRVKPTAKVRVKPTAKVRKRRRILCASEIKYVSAAYHEVTSIFSLPRIQQGAQMYIDVSLHGGKCQEVRSTWRRRW